MSGTERYRLHGAAPYRAVVLHGGPGAPGCAAGLCRALAEYTGVVEHLQSAHTAGELCDEIACLTDEFCGGRAVVIGHSYGAWLALLFAQKYPIRAGRVILIGCGPLTADYVPMLAETRRTRLEAGVSDTDNFCALPGSSGDMLYFDREQHVSLMQEMSGLRERKELMRIARSVACPVLAVHGAYDPHPVQGVSGPMAGKENFRMIVLENCGHDPWKETDAREEFLGMMGRELG